MQKVRGKSYTDGLRDEVFQLSDAGKISFSDISGDKELRKAYRELSLKSLYFLVKAVLMYTRLTIKTHLEICKFIESDIKRTLLLLPRGTFKTTVASIGFTIQHFLRNPNLFVLIASQTDSNATRILLEIEEHFEGKNPLMNWLFPEYIKPGDRFKPWSEGRMNIPCRTILSGTPSITAIGIGGRAESPHYHIVIPDDLIGEKARDSAPEMEKAILWVDGMEALFMSPAEGIVRMSGTHWGGNDLYTKVKKDSRYKVLWKPARDNITKELFFPDLLPDKVLDGIKKTNLNVFLTQYQNDVENSIALEFKLQWLNYYSLIEVNGEPCCLADDEYYPVSEMDVVISVDPAASGDEESQVAGRMHTGRATLANNAVGVMGTHKSGKVFLLDLWVGRSEGENPERQCAVEMLNMCRKWYGYFRVMVIEGYGAQGAFMTIFNMLCDQTNERYPVELTPKGMQKAKNVRIRTLIGSVTQNGLLYIRRCHDAFEDEYRKFPQGTKDVLDMASWAVYTMIKPASEVQEDLYGEERREILNERNRCIGVTGY